MIIRGPGRRDADAGAQPNPLAVQPVIENQPLTLSATIDVLPGRWLWLVKWILLVPHIVVLTGLWAGFALAAVAAGLCILFTRRYPRPLFAFNVGVLRWTWRVGHYSYLALGTDRYPPFTLRAVTYPAALEVSYPTELSRWLVLVKWLLVVPHLIIVGILVGSTFGRHRAGPRTEPFARDRDRDQDRARHRRRAPAAGHHGALTSSTTGRGHPTTSPDTCRANQENLMTHQHDLVDQNATGAHAAAFGPGRNPASDDAGSDHSTGIRHRIMIVDGVFLALVGVAQVALEVLAHFVGVGPYAGILGRSAYTIGWVEAHGLAAVIGVLLLVVGARDRRRFWHAFALAVHLLLGAANLVFWQSFVDFATVPLGTLGTAAHVLFATAQAWSLFVSRPGNRS